MRYELSPADLTTIHSLVTACAARHPCVENEALLRDAALFSHELPRDLRRFLTDFKLSGSDDGVCLVSGYPIDQRKLGATPPHWIDAARSRAGYEEQIALVLLSSLIGDPFGWATQQTGRIVHDVIPIREHEHEQIGSNSKEPLTWHTEDAFHPFQGDYVGLFCLRNPTQTPTTIGAIDAVRMSPQAVDLLFASEFTILPDKSHQALNNGNGTGTGNGDGHSPANGNGGPAGVALERDKGARHMPVLFGSPQSPYVRLDPYFMRLGDETSALRALGQLIDEIERNLREIVLEPGDFCFIDNLKAVHGRRRFVPLYDGNDRWLKRLNITRDLRKSRGARPSNESRIVY